MKQTMKLLLLAALVFAASHVAEAQKLLVNKTYYHTGLSFDGTQWTQTGATGSVGFKVYDTHLQLSDGTRAVRRGDATVYGFTGKKYVSQGANGQEYPARYYLVSNNLDIAEVLALTFWGQTHTSLILYSQVPVSTGGTSAPSQPNYNRGSQQSVRVVCRKCNGKGRVVYDSYPPQYSGSRSYPKYCSECGQTFPSSRGHSHVTCGSCGGRGYTR